MVVLITSFLADKKLAAADEVKVHLCTAGWWRNQWLYPPRVASVRRSANMALWAAGRSRWHSRDYDYTTPLEQSLSTRTEL